MLRSEIGHTTPTEITVRGVNLADEIIGKMDFVETLVLCALGRCPTVEEKTVINALLVVALDHGLTPSSIAARLTYAGAPESMSGAVAAGLLGAGTRFLGPSAVVAKRLRHWTVDLSDAAPPESYDAVADRMIVELKASKGRIPGYGHPIHRQGDPRVPALRRLVEDNGFYGKGWKLADALEVRLATGTPALPMNASAAVGATVHDMGLDPAFAIGLTLVGRCGGLIAHVLEEKTAPIGQEAWELIATQDPRVDFGDKT